MADKPLSNRAFADTEHFKKLCEKAGVQPTTRQASKFRNQMGKAYANRDYHPHPEEPKA